MFPTAPAARKSRSPTSWARTSKKLSDADCDKNAIVWAADSKSLLWTGTDHKLRRVDIDTGKEEVLASSDAGNIGEPQFSPDGKWISYSKPDKLLRTHVWVKELATGQEHMIASDQFMNSRGAKWTPDGKKLLVLGGNGGGAGIASTGGRGTLAALQRGADAHREGPQRPRHRYRSAGRGGGARIRRPPAGAADAGAGAPANVQVKIEWDGIDRRISQLTAHAGSVATVVPSPDGRTYLFMAQGAAPAAKMPRRRGGGPAMYTIAEDGTRLTRLNTTVPDASRRARPRRARRRRRIRRRQPSRSGRATAAASTSCRAAAFTASRSAPALPRR